MAERVQCENREAIEVIGRIGVAIGELDEVQTAVASAIEEQNATTSEIVRSVTEAAGGSGEIAERNRELVQLSGRTRSDAERTSRSAQELSGLGDDLARLVGKYRW
ncbi:MAG: hypothetical protein H6828_12025 [Planctomycetes bacterium]|nr:hypothetical protein [Planctomycetota bacterium]